MSYISENHGLSDKELDDFKFRNDLSRFPSILVHGYNPLLEGQWIPACATDGQCFSLGLLKPGMDPEIRSFKYFYNFIFRPANIDKARWPGTDLRYQACTGCNRPIRLYDAMRLNTLLGFTEPKRVIKKIDLEGLDDFW